MAQIAQLQQQTVSLQPSSTSSTGTNPVPSSTSSTSETCPDLHRTLSLGSNGSDVSDLQRFLATQNLFSGNPTGYYGQKTETAVRTWQAAQGIVKSGDASSTGWGVVGRKTREVIANVCGSVGVSPFPNGQPLSCQVAMQPTNPCSTGWKAVTDKWGCTLSYECALPLGSVGTVTQPSWCPSVTVPSCSGKLVSVGTSANGCNLGYTCTVAPNVQCPIYPAPTCGSGYTLQNGGTDSNGCALAQRCVAVSSNACPVYSSCPSGYAAQTSLDSSGCTVLQCVAQSTSLGLSVSFPSPVSIGSSVRVDWQSSGPSGSYVNLYLMNLTTGQVSNAIANHLQTSGSYTWSVPTSVIYADVGTPLRNGSYQILAKLLSSNYCVVPTGAPSDYCATAYGPGSTSIPLSTANSGTFTVTGASQ